MGKKPKKLIDELFVLDTPFANFREGIELFWIMYDEYMEFRVPEEKSNTATLNYHQVTDADYNSETKLVHKKKGMAESALKGSLVWGQTGAVIGAMSAMDGDKSKGKQRTCYYVSIVYTGSDGEEHEIQLEDTSGKHRGLTMVNKLREMMGKPLIDLEAKQNVKL